MGKKIVDEDMVLNIIINGDKGKNELFKLEQAVRDLNGENEKLERSLQKYDRQIAVNEKTIIRYTASLEKEQEKQVKLQQQFEQASEKVATLNQRYKELSKTERNTPAGERLKKEMFAASEALRRYTEQGRATISAQKGLAESIQKLTNENTKLNAKREEATAILNKNRNAIEKGGQEINKLRKNLDVTTLSIDELNREITRMSLLFRQADPNSPAWEEYRKKLVELRSRHQQLSAQAQQTKGVLCRMADGINKYWNLVVTGLASLSGVIFSIKGAISKFVEFSDVISDVQKTTGLTERGVEDLSESLKNVDTRTAQEELMGLARIGGKLGIEGKENLEGFVRAADKINVALREDLGGDTEESIRQVGKLVDIFKVEEEFGIEQGMLKVGSVINELGAASTANEGYIVEFSKRVAGVAPSAGISVDAVMGLAATLDQFGQQAEASSTVYSQMMSKMFKNTAAYANIAGMSLTDFSELMKKDANEAFIRVLEGLNGNNEGMEALVRNLGDMQLNGVRASAILGTLANHTTDLREQQKLANEAFREGTSLTNEFNIKNNNLAAMRDKAKKQLDERIRQLGKQLQPLLVLCINSMSMMVKMLGALITFFGKYGVVILQLVSVYGAYLVAVKLNVLWENKLRDAIKAKNIIQKLDIFFTKAQTAGTYLLASAKALLTGNIKKARVAFQSFSRAVKMNPLGLLLSVVLAVGFAIYNLCTRLNDTEKAMKRVSEANLEFEKSVAAEQITIDRLFGKLKAATEGTKEWEAARKAITDKYGQYLSDLGIEIKTLGDAKKAYDALSISIRETTREKAMEQARQNAAKAYVDTEVEQLRRIKEAIDETYENAPEKAARYFQQMKSELNRGGTMSRNMSTVMLNAGIEANVAKLKAAKKAYKIEMAEIESIFSGRSENVVQKTSGESVVENKGNPVVKTSVNTDNSDYDGKIIALKESYAAQKITKEEYEKQLDTLELAHLEYRLKTFEGTEEKRLELQQKIADKKVAIREKQNKEGKSKSEDYINAILADNNTAIQKEELAFTERLRKSDLYGKDKSQMTENQLKALEILEKQHQDNIRKIEENSRKEQTKEYMKGITDRIKNLEIAQKMELEQKKSEYYDNLSKTDSLTQRKQLTKDFQKDIADLTEKQMVELANLLNELLVQMDIDSDVDMGEVILSDEQKEQLLSRLNEAKEKIESLKNMSDYDKAKNYNVDILGMDAGQWEVFFKHLEDGKMGIEDLQIAIQAVSAAWSTYDKLKTAQEKKELKQYEKNTKQKKAALDKQLDAGQISQEQYNARTAQLDADLDAKKEAIEQKQAERQRKMAIFQTIINTAAGIVKLWIDPGFPAAIPLTVMLGALGAAEIATIIAAQYAKGKYPVIGDDDGRTYQADYAGDNLRTGIYQNPTLGLFSEREPEMVVDGATTRKLVFNYPQIYESIMDVAHGRTPQFASGKYPLENASISSNPAVVDSSDPEIKALLRKNIEMMESLKNMDVVIPMYGRGGLMKALKKAQNYEQKITY